MPPICLILPNSSGLAFSFCNGSSFANISTSTSNTCLDVCPEIACCPESGLAPTFGLLGVYIDPNNLLLYVGTISGLSNPYT